MAKGHYLQFRKHTYLPLDKLHQITLHTMYILPIHPIRLLFNEITPLLMFLNAYNQSHQSLFINPRMSPFFLHLVTYLLLLFPNLIPFRPIMHLLDILALLYHLLHLHTTLLKYLMLTLLYPLPKMFPFSPVNMIGDPGTRQSALSS